MHLFNLLSAPALFSHELAYGALRDRVFRALQDAGRSLNELHWPLVNRLQHPTLHAAIIHLKVAWQFNHREAAEWRLREFQNRKGRRVRLAYFPDRAFRTVDLRYPRAQAGTHGGSRMR